jgi:hypothetical protein
MIFQSKMQQRVSDLEARVRAIEARLGEKQLARITDNPPTVEHAFALRETIKAAKALTAITMNSPDGNVRMLSGEIQSWIAAMEM